MDNPPDSGPCEVTITAPRRGWLQSFVKELVEDRLAAAAHIDVMNTTYRWNDVVNEAEEARAILHTTGRCVPAIDARLTAAHEFEVPCLVQTQIVSGRESYLRWIEDSVR